MEPPHKTSADCQRFVMLDMSEQAPALRQTFAFTTPYLRFLTITRPYVTHQFTRAVFAAYS